MPEFTHLAPDDITVASFNPQRRTQRNGLGGLMISIQQHGILEPLALTKTRVLADGHRRLACAKLVKLKTVPVAIHHESELDAPSLWVALNAESLALTPSQWLDAVAHGLPLETAGFPESLKRRIIRLQELVGKDGVMELVEMGRSPNILDSAERIAKYCDRRDDLEFLKLAVLWMTETGNSFAVRAAMDEEIPQDLLLEAIEQGHPLMRVWDVAR
jgi:ParB-like chromosome segregation protein Spo0J